MHQIRRRSFLKSIAAGSVGVGAISLLSACSEPDSGQAIKMAIPNRPTNLDPRFATDALSSRINRLLYRQLIDFDEHSKPIPDLATWQQISPTLYQFQLNNPGSFHHQKPLNAKDVVETYRSVLAQKTGSPHRGALKVIKNLKILSETEFEIELNQPDNLFIGRLTLGILPADLLASGHKFNLWPIGSGAAKFVSLNEQKLVLQRQDQTELHFVVVKDPMVRILKLKKGEVDLLQNDLSPELASYCEAQPDLVVDWEIGNSFGYIGFNFENPQLADPRLRQAIAQGINREQIIAKIFGGQARLAGGLLAPEHWAGNRALTGWEYNPQAAKQLVDQLKQEGQIQGDLSLSFKTSSDPTRVRLVTLYQAQLKEIGIDLKIQSYDWGTFYSDITKGRFELFSLAWVGIKSPDIFSYVFAQNAVPPQGANRGRYKNAQIDKLIELAEKTEEIAEQAAIYQRIQQILQQDLAVIPLWYENQYLVRRANLQGYKLYQDGRFDSLIDCYFK